MAASFSFSCPLYESFVFYSELQKDFSYGLVYLFLYRIRTTVEVQHGRYYAAAVFGGLQKISEMYF